MTMRRFKATDALGKEYLACETTMPDGTLFQFSEAAAIFQYGSVEAYLEYERSFYSPCEVKH